MLIYDTLGKSIQEKKLYTFIVYVIIFLILSKINAKELNLFENLSNFNLII